MNKEVLKTKNLNNFGHVSVNSDHSLFVKKYYDFLKYKLHPNEYFVYNKMKNHHKIMPFWAAKTLDEVTTLTQYHFDQSNYTTSPYYGIISGIDESNCPLPCKLTKVL